MEAQTTTPNPAATAAPPDGSSGNTNPTAATKAVDKRHKERGETKVDPRQAVIDVLQRSGREAKIGEMRTAAVKWMRKTTRGQDQIFGYEQTDEGLFREFPGQGEPPKVYPMLTLRYTPTPGNTHRCVLVTLPSMKTDRQGNKMGEILVTYALPVDRRPLFRSEEWNDNALSVIEVEHFQESRRKGACFYGRGPNGKGVVIRDKSFVPPNGKVRVLVTEEISSFTALCLDESRAEGDEAQSAPSGSGDLALLGDVMQVRLTDDPWYFTYNGHMYGVLAVLGGDLTPQSTMEELKAHFAELGKTETLPAKIKAFRKQWSIKTSKKDEDAFSKEWGLIVACYKQMEQNLLRRDMEAAHKATGAGKFRFVDMNQVRLKLLAETLHVSVEDVRQLLANIGYSTSRSVLQVARSVAETVCGYYIEKNPAAAPKERIEVGALPAIKSTDAQMLVPKFILLKAGLGQQGGNARLSVGKGKTAVSRTAKEWLTAIQAEAKSGDASKLCVMDDGTVKTAAELVYDLTGEAVNTAVEEEEVELE